MRVFSALVEFLFSVCQKWRIAIFTMQPLGLWHNHVFERQSDVYTGKLHDELNHWLDVLGLLTRWVSWCTAVFMVRHLGTSPTISSHPPTSLLGSVYVPQTDTSSSYLAVVSTHTAVGRFRLLIRRPGTGCLTSWEICRVVLTVLSSFLKQSCLVFTNMTSALEVFKMLCAI